MSTHPQIKEYSKLIQDQRKMVSAFQLSPSRLRADLFSLIGEFYTGEDEAMHAELRLKEDCLLDSLDMVELIMMCEKDFYVSLPDIEWTKAKTIADLETLIRKYSA